MIESTFCFLPGVGTATEQRWWREGLGTWTVFLSRPDAPGISRTRKAAYDEDVATAEVHYRNGDARFFARCLAPRDQWRLYEWLRPKAVYLDIETDSFGVITVVGLYGNGAMTSLVRGDSLTERRLRGELAPYDLMVTFCGARFDVPMLRAQFPSILPALQGRPHVDLYGPARALGLHGGLKAIEETVGLTRREDLLGMNGFDAVRCWNRWRHERDTSALERLIAYNEADCVNLEPLADLLYCRLAERHQPGSRPAFPHHGGAGG
jgi:uncharacterized protein YprB with RNaseH-like and TPR domain